MSNAYDRVVEQYELDEQWAGVLDKWAHEQDVCVRCRDVFRTIDNIGQWQCYQPVTVDFGTLDFSAGTGHLTSKTREYLVRADHVGQAELRSYIADSRDHSTCGGGDLAMALSRSGSIAFIDPVRKWRTKWRHDALEIPLHAWSVFSEYIPIDAVSPASMRNELARRHEHPASIGAELLFGSGERFDVPTRSKATTHRVVRVMRYDTETADRILMDPGSLDRDLESKLILHGHDTIPQQWYYVPRTTPRQTIMRSVW